MEYTSEQFMRLLQEIERQGGHHRDATHDPVHHESLSGPSEKNTSVKYCGENALFEVDYEGAKEGARVCAVCDNLALWPRFKEAKATE